MSVKRRLEGKSEGLRPSVPTETPMEDGVRTPKTAPGQMFVFREAMGEADIKMRDLEQRLQQYEGSLPTCSLDARRIRVSAFANRHQLNWTTEEFEAFKQDIAAAGGNVQPVLVRPVKDDPAADFELCFGHRRHRACLDLGLSLRAVIEEVSDQSLFQMMARENLFRKDLTPYETGTFYRRALTQGLYAHQLALATALNVSPAMVSRALAVADLPAEVVEAFPSPLQIQYRWGLELVEALKTRSEQVLEAAARLRAERGQHGARAVHHALLRKPMSKAIPVKAGGKTAATITMRDEAVTIAFGKGRVPTARLQELRKVIADFLSEEG
jgi:ParB family chromosome partitioning protein